jgi:hypothetical protein
VTVATLLALFREVQAYALGAKLLERAFEVPGVHDFPWLEKEPAPALGQIVLLCDCFLMPKASAGLTVEDRQVLVELRDEASTLLARRALG